jgi:2,5-diketo-D-gluconate reductase B
MKLYTLKNGKTIPALGFGTWKLTGSECTKAVLYALRIGYRHIDTADVYGNHKEVGQAIAEGRVPRNELFVTSKIWTDSFERSKVRPSCERLLSELQLEYLDLLLMHWPDRSIPFGDTLEEMEKLQKDGLVKSIGVSNFTINHLKDALETGVEFVTNQVEFHPSLNQKELKAFCDEHKIIITAYSPLARGEDLDLPMIIELAEKYNKTPAQIILNWVIQSNMIAIPKSATLERIEENWKTLEFELSSEDVAKIDAIGGNNRVVNSDWGDFDY